MYLQLENMYAYRFYEEDKGPLDTIRKYSLEEIDLLGYEAGIAHIREIYHNRVNMENMMLALFKRNGGKPQINFPIYFAVYDELPEFNKLHVRFKNPMCIKMPMKEFCKQHVSFTYGLSTHAFTRKDNHPCRRKLLSWDEAEQVINTIPFDKREDLWLEMQVWDETCIQNYYEQNRDKIYSVEMDDRLTEEDIEKMHQQYDIELSNLNRELFFEPDGLHGVLHAIRVCILSQHLAELHHLNDNEKNILKLCALFHDIGRENNMSDAEHGYVSYQKLVQNDLLPESFIQEQRKVIQFIIENHPFSDKLIDEKVNLYQIENKDAAINLFHIFKDADILDLCRYGSVNKHILNFMTSRDVVPFAFQLLLIYRENSNYEKHTLE